MRHEQNEDIYWLFASVLTSIDDDKNNNSYVELLTEAPVPLIFLFFSSPAALLKCFQVVKAIELNIEFKG